MTGHSTANGGSSRTPRDELRTPLAINRTLIEVAIEDPAVPDSTRKLGETLLTVNRRQERLIDGLLMLAGSTQRLDAVAKVDVAMAAHRAMSTANAAATEARIAISSNLSPGYVQGDSVLLDRLAQNLVDNAVRYNLADAGWVHVTVAPDAGAVRLVVENSGPAVPPDEVDALFEPFRRHDHEPVAGGGGGTGLGLSIVRSVTTAHGGVVVAHARPGGGLVVEVTLPASQ